MFPPKPKPKENMFDAAQSFFNQASQTNPNNASAMPGIQGVDLNQSAPQNFQGPSAPALTYKAAPMPDLSRAATSSQTVDDGSAQMQEMLNSSAQTSSNMASAAQSAASDSKANREANRKQDEYDKQKAEWDKWNKGPKEGTAPINPGDKRPEGSAGRQMIGGLKKVFGKVFGGK